MLDVTPTAVKGLLQRARAALGPPPEPPSPDEARAGRALRPAPSPPTTSTASIALLTDDAGSPCRPRRTSTDGREAIAAFLRASAAYRTRRFAPHARAHERPAGVRALLRRPDRAHHPRGRDLRHHPLPRHELIDGGHPASEMRFAVLALVVLAGCGSTAVAEAPPRGLKQGRRLPALRADRHAADAVAVRVAAGGRVGVHGVHERERRPDARPQLRLPRRARAGPAPPAAGRVQERVAGGHLLPRRRPREPATASTIPGS